MSAVTKPQTPLPTTQKPQTPPPTHQRPQTPLPTHQTHSTSSQFNLFRQLFSEVESLLLSPYKKAEDEDIRNAEAAEAEAEAQRNKEAAEKALAAA